MSAEAENEPDASHGLTIVPVREALDGSALDGAGSLTQQVCRLVRKLAAELILLPNQFLSEKDVAASLSISKTPVREAFIRLAEDGIVRIVPKSGTYIAPIDFDRAREGYFIWSALESSCAAQAASQCSLGDIRRLRDELGRMKQCMDAGDAAGFAACCEAVYVLIYDAADLPDAKKLVEAARFEVDRIIHVAERRKRRPMQAVFGEFTDLINAVARHDPEEASRCMAVHMEQAERALDAMISDSDLARVFEFLSRKRPGVRRPRAAGKARRAPKKHCLEGDNA